MKKFIPTSYYKNIFEINYDKLKRVGIKCLLFDLDNTLGLIDEEFPTAKATNLIKKLKKDFIIIIISNNYKERIDKYVSPFQVEYFSFAMKPFPTSLRKIRLKYHLEKNEMVIVGDQLMTDILAGGLYKINTILVDPLGIKDLKVTSINRFFERMVLRKLKRKGYFEKGKYYEKIL